MIVAYRRWGIRRHQVAVRRVPTGRRIARPAPVPGWEPWVLAQSPPELANLAFEVVWEPEVREVPILQDTLVGLPGRPGGEWAWQPGHNTAACRTRGAHTPPVDHEVDPDTDPGCGFYGVKTRSLLDPTWPSTALGGGPGGCFCSIVGLAGLSGEVTEGPCGYRASHARVLALLAPPAWRANRHHRGSPCPCGGCSPPFSVVAAGGDWDEPAETHLPGLADRYQVPIFADSAALERYAAELQEPRTWPVTELPHPPQHRGVVPHSVAAALRQVAARMASQPIRWTLSSEPAPATPPPPLPSSSGGFVPRGFVPAPKAWWGAGSPPPGVLPRRRPGRDG